MLARLQQAIALMLLVGLLATVAVGWKLGSAGLVAGFLALVIGGYATALAIEFAWSWRSYEAKDSFRPAFAQLVRAWLAEAAAAPQVFLWRQPFEWNRHPDHLTPAAQGRRGVLLIHGFFCNRGLWNPWLEKLGAMDVPFVAVNLEPVFGAIDDYRQRIDTAARRLEHATGLAPVIVGHSMGGLAARAWLEQTPAPPWHRLVTIASPHAGTRLGVHGRGENIAQMRVGSEWLARLADREPADMRARFTCYWSHCDNIVFPTRSAMLAGADNRHLTATPHVKMVYHPEVFEEVLRSLHEP